MLKVHHLNCGTMCAIGGRLFYGEGPHHLVCHCMLIESNAGLVLIDTGLGLSDVRGGRKALGRIYTSLSRPVLKESETAVRQIEALGFSARDVRHIVLTHLDLDHAGGLPDFPNACVHVYGPERREALSSSHHRYRPALWPDAHQWRTYDELGEPWFGFESVRSLDGLPPEILIIPLVGHSAGHAGIAVSSTDGWYLHCGDAYFHRDAVRPEGGQAPLGVRLFERKIEHDRAMRIANQERLRKLSTDHGDEIRIFCAHDAVEFESYHNAKSS